MVGALSSRGAGRSIISRFLPEYFLVAMLVGFMRTFFASRLANLSTIIGSFKADQRELQTCHLK